jgi:hypothetical protein
LASSGPGGDPFAVDRSLAPWGLPMTPPNLTGYIGPRYSGISVTTCAVPTSVLPSKRHGIDPDRVRRRVRDGLAEEAQLMGPGHIYRGPGCGALLSGLHWV